MVAQQAAEPNVPERFHRAREAVAKLYSRDADIPMTEAVDTLIHARWVIPGDPAGQVLEHHTTAIRGGQIVDVLPTGTAAARYSAGVSITRPTHALLPGLVNGAVEVTQASDMPHAAAAAELSMARMLAHGITCFASRDLCADIIAERAAVVGIRGVIGLPVGDRPTSWAMDADLSFARALELRDAYQSAALISTAFAPAGPETLSDATLLRMQRIANEIDLPILMPLQGTTAVDTANRMLERLERMGLLSSQLIALNPSHLEPADFELVALRGVQGIVTPRTVLGAGERLAPVRRLTEAGINVGIGTLSSQPISLLEELRTLVLFTAQRAPGTRNFLAAELLRMATCGGARSLGLGDLTGSIEPGKAADLCCVDMNSPHTQPILDLVGQLVHVAGGGQTSDVWVAGRQLIADGTFTTIDVADVIRRAAHGAQ